MFWFIFMILIWFCYGWFYDFDMVDFSCSDFVTGTLCFQPPPPQQYQRPISDPELRYVFFFLALRFCVCGPPAPTRATQHRKPTTANKHGTWLPPQPSHSQSWNMDGSDLKSQAQENQIVYLCICHSRLTRIIPVRPCRLFLGSLGTSLWEALSGKSWHIALRSLRGGKSCGAVDSDVFHFNIGAKLPFFRAERGKVVLKSD